MKINEVTSPRVFYHGSNSKFNAFKSGLNAYWFTPDIKSAKSQGDNVIAAKLTMNNPYEWQVGDPEPDNTQFRDELLTQGYDSVIAPSNISADDDYIVFSPSQIKIVQGHML